MGSEIEGVSPADLLSTLRDTEKDVGIRREAARKIGKVSGDRLNPVMAGLPAILNQLFERRNETSEELQVFGETLIALGRLCFTFPEEDQMKVLLTRNLEKIDLKEEDFVDFMLKALKNAVNAHPELILQLKEKFNWILANGDLDTKKLALNVITRAAWTSPQVLGDFIPDIREMITEGTDELRTIALQAIYRVSRKNFYVVESIIKDIIPERVDESEEETIFILASVEVPPEEEELIQKIFELNEHILMESTNSSSIIRAANSLADLVEKKEFGEFQEKFAEDLRIKIESASDDEEKAGLISTIAVPNWADTHILEPLISLSIETLTSGVESKKVKMEAAKVLHSNLLLYHEFAEEIVDAYTEVLDTGWEEELKSKIIDLLVSIPILDEEGKRKVVETLIRFFGREEEEILARMAASDALVEFVSQSPKIINEFGEEIADVYNSVTITDIKRSIIEAAGEVMKSIDATGKTPFISILVDALTSKNLYYLSLEHLNTITYDSPELLAPYDEKLFEFPRMIAEIEADEDLGRVERISYLERPKRFFVKILAGLIEIKPEITEKAVDVFLALLKTSDNDTLIREISYALRDAYKVKPEMVEKTIEKADISKEKITTVRGLLERM